MLCSAREGLTQSQLITLLPLWLHAGGSGLRLYDGSDLCRFVPDALALVQLLVFFASAFQLFLAVESSSSFHLCIRFIFMFSEMLH